MNTRHFKKIRFCSTFEDLCKIVNINSQAYTNIEVINYEYLVYNHKEISGLYHLNSLYKVSNCSIGFLHFNGFIPESMRCEIISNIHSRKFFEQMHNIMFCQYIKLVSLKNDQKTWYNLVLNLLNYDLINNINASKRAIYASKSTFNVRQQSLLDTINNMVNINLDTARIERHHIFKIRKRHIPYLGIFNLGSNTIGSHYYTSMCSFIYLQLSSKDYNRFIANIKRIFKKLNLQIPEFKVVFVISILDANYLSFKLGSCILSLSSFIILDKQRAENIINIIFE